MKSATVTLIRDGEISPMMSRTYVEEVRGISDIQSTPTHIVFELNDGNVIGYKADRVYEFVTYNEDE
jgi:hypothetical protein